MAKIEGFAVLDYLKERNNNLYRIVYNTTREGRAFMKREYQDRLCCEVLNENIIVISNTNEYAINSRIKVDLSRSIVEANSGCTSSCGATNMFLDEGLPNSLYVIDGFIEITTDQLGRTVSAIRNFNSTINKKPRLSKERRDVLKITKHLKAGEDVGHLLQRCLGGINEGINLLPMPQKWQENGIWRKLEALEEEIVKQEKNKRVKSLRKIFYVDETTLPSSIGFELDVDENPCIKYIVPYPV